MGLVDAMVAANHDEQLLGNNGQEVYCTCDELILGEGRDRHRVPCPKFHDCVYVARRNALLPVAIEHALEVVRKKPDDDSHSRAARFSRALSIEMDRLARPLLRKGA